MKNEKTENSAAYQLSIVNCQLSIVLFPLRELLKRKRQ